MKKTTSRPDRFKPTTRGMRVYLRWASFLRPHLRLLLAGCVALLAVMGIDVLLPKILGFVIDRMLKPSAIDAGFFTLPVAGPQPLVRAFLIVLAALIAIILLRAALIYSRNMLIATVGEKVHVDIRSKLFDHLQRLPISYFDKSYTGRIMARLTTDTDALWHLLFNGMLNVAAPVITIVVVAVVLLRIHVVLTLAAFSVMPVIVVLFYYARKRARTAAQAQRETLSDIYSRLQEQITGIRLVRIFGRSVDESQDFMLDMNELFGRNIEMLKTSMALSVRSEFVTGAATGAVLCLGGIAVTMHQITVGQLMQFYLYTGMLFAPLQMITNTFAQVFTAAEVALERIFELLDQPVAEETRGVGLPCPPITGRITIDHLTFGYEKEKQVLCDLSLEIAPGSTVALVGPSGVGKSTLVNLITRFYHYEQGSIKIDGNDLSGLEVESYRQQISYVSQDSFMFSGSIAENIRYASPDASRERIEEVARLANAHEFILQMPKGYDTELGERGVKLSGGQRQRINIARALIRNPRILIMDEPTSALDAESESVILEALESVFKGLTCIIIAHRLSTVMSVDRIFVFNEGRLAQQGSHRELVEKEGVYRDLCRRQFVGFGGSETKLDDK